MKKEKQKYKVSGVPLFEMPDGSKVRGGVIVRVTVEAYSESEAEELSGLAMPICVGKEEEKP